MKEAYVRGRRLRPTQQIGEGGEADVFDVSSDFPGESLVLKLWKGADHPDYQGTDSTARANQRAASERMVEYGQKLQVFPRGLAAHVVAPRDIAFNRTGDRILGYTMPFLRGADMLQKLSEKSFRRTANIDKAGVLRIFRHLLFTVRALHAQGIVIGDFNYFNVLIKGLEAYLIDADSFQFGAFLSRSFTPRFLDPLRCDRSLRAAVPIHAATPQSDWYAFALMLFECLLHVHPYGGVYAPKRKLAVVSPDARPLKGISVFHPEVIYPVMAEPVTWLPKGAVDYYRALLEQDVREAFPEDLLEALMAHAEGRAPVLAAALKELIRGRARSTPRFSTTGRILAAALDHGKLRYLYVEGGALKREGGTTVLNGTDGQGLTFALQADETLVARGDVLAVLSPNAAIPPVAVDEYHGKTAVFAANDAYRFWVHGGQLKRNDLIGEKLMGTVLEGQTLIWVGPRFGFGFYRAGAITQGFTFDVERAGLFETKLPALKGELTDAACSFTSERCWFHVTLRLGGELTHKVFVLNASGQLLAAASAKAGDGSWLESIHGRCAATLTGSNNAPLHALFVVTPQGLMGVAEENGQIVERAGYPETADLLDPADVLLFDPNVGLYIVRPQEIRVLTLA